MVRWFRSDDKNNNDDDDDDGSIHDRGQKPNKPQANPIEAKHPGSFSTSASLEIVRPTRSPIVHPGTNNTRVRSGLLFFFDPVSRAPILLPRVFGTTFSDREHHCFGVVVFGSTRGTTNRCAVEIVIPPRPAPRRNDAHFSILQHTYLRKSCDAHTYIKKISFQSCNHGISI